jgi:hypothetical protein|tara:strand:+ start:1831 stop:2217 length:387 start_codon:yes stop_codon:yes gene_type:complete
VATKNEVMKKVILILILLTTLTNVSYASFPLSSVVDTPITDTILNIETTEQYHLRIQKMGFDLSNCNCDSCREEVSLGDGFRLKKKAEVNVRPILITLGVWLIVGIAILVVLVSLWIWNGIKNFDSTY